MTYQECVLSNLRDLLGPETLVNPGANLACAYAELEKLFSTLPPHPTAEPATDVAQAIAWAAGTCGCGDELRHLRHVVDDCRRGHAEAVRLDQVRAAVALVMRVIASLREQSSTVSCRCGAGVRYRFAEALDVVPPTTYRLTCPVCGNRTEWFIPRPSD